MNAVDSEVELYGSAFVALDDIRLEADRIVYSQATNQACAYGRRDSAGRGSGDRC